MDVANTACPVGTTKDDLDRNSTRLSRLLSTVKESFVPVEADVEGSIPEWLEGELVRVGPGMFEINGHKLNHLLDGMSILHKFSINNGRVTYQSKYLRGDNFKSNMAKQRIVVSEFGTVAAPDPCDSIFKRFVAKFHLPKPGDNCNVNILPFQNDECYAVTETQFLRKFDPNSLDAQEKIDLKELVSVNLATAHPHFDVDGTMYNIGSAFSGKPTYCVIKVPPTSKPENGESASAFNQASVLAKVPGQFKAYPCYMHSFAMTQNFIVLMEQPFYMNVLKMLKNQLLGFPAVDCFEFSNEYKTKIHVVRKCTGEVLEQQYTSPAQIVLHHINAYEDGNHVVMDFIDIEDASVFGNATLDEFRRTGGDVMRGVAKRLVFPVTIPQDARAGENLVSLKTSASAILQEDGSVHCESETLSRNFDLPTINMKYSGKKYRFFYATGMFSPGEFENTVVKCDTETKQLKTWKVSPTQYYSEPIFVPSPLAEEEDDGVVLCGVSDVSPDTPDYLVVLDGKSFTELGRATIPDKLRVPYGLHGQFLSP